MDGVPEPEEWTIITAMNRVLQYAEDSHLDDEFFESCKNSLAYLRQELGLTDIQIIVLAIMVESGEPMSWRNLGNYLGCTRLSIMVYSEEIEALVAKRWIFRKSVREIGGVYEGFVLARGVVRALRNNQVFVPEKIDDLTEQQFVDMLENHITRNMRNRNADFGEEENWMHQLVQANQHLPLCRTIMKYDDIHVQSLLLMIIVDYAQWEGSEGEGMNFDIIDDIYPEEHDCNFMRYQLKEGTHVLISDGLIEYKCDDGHVDSEQYILTNKTKKEMLSSYSPSHSKCKKAQPNKRFLKNAGNIKEKSLFFNVTEQQQIERLTSLLSVENMPSVQQRLEEQGMRKGFACLFYGSPGTGKTETVYQIARKTGRDLMQVDIAGLRDKWVGESEKNIKEVFARYRQYCKNCTVMPILFFNEADAIINKRTENITHSIDKMDNAMQNIILQEIEDLDGILIATTNLTINLDKAFERRFLYKIEFRKPDTDVKTRIWRSMLKDISDEEARHLAMRFDFSGGQIENIARKRTVDYILSGQYATLDKIEGYCRAELFANKERRSIGFTLSDRID
jgi:hypothetical protein